MLLFQDSGTELRVPGELRLRNGEDENRVSGLVAGMLHPASHLALPGTDGSSTLSTRVVLTHRKFMVSVMQIALPPIRTVYPTIY